jgi:hypothetical protein
MFSSSDCAASDRGWSVVKYNRSTSRVAVGATQKVCCVRKVAVLGDTSERQKRSSREDTDDADDDGTWVWTSMYRPTVTKNKILLLSQTASIPAN